MGHLVFPDVEPPLSGAGPVRNLSRVTIEAAPTLAPYNGAATARASPNGVSNVSELVGDFTVFWNFGMQMLQQKDKVTILYANDYAVRHVYMNRTHPEHVTPTWYGDSVGHYEGDTLVIDAVGIKVGPFCYG
jgi:hypothetical protein